MSFCCPIHGYYTPQPGVTLAICPTCSSSRPVAGVIYGAAAVLAREFGIDKGERDDARKPPE